MATTTTLEDWIALRLHKAGLPRPECQHPIGPYKVDFAWPTNDPKIVLEADGPYHETTAGRLRDTDRDKYLMAEGWVVLRIYRDEEALAQLCRALHRLLDKR